MCGWVAGWVGVSVGDFTSSYPRGSPPRYQGRVQSRPMPPGGPRVQFAPAVLNDQLCQLGFHVLSETLAVNLAVLTVRG